MNTDALNLWEEIVKLCVTCALLAWSGDLVPELVRWAGLRRRQAAARSLEPGGVWEPHARADDDAFHLGGLASPRAKVVLREAHFVLPSVLYTLQQVFFWLALQYMDPPTYQVMNNAKLVFTGTMQHAVLKQLLSPRQQGSLVLLAGGIVTTQVSGKTLGQLFALPPQAYAFSLATSFSAAAANVWLAYLYKHSGTTFHLVNARLYAWGCALRVGALLINAGGRLGPAWEGMFAGFDAAAIVLLLLGSVGHIVTGAVVKYHSAVAKSYSAAAAIPLTALLSWALFGKQPAARFLLGAPAVCIAIVLYTTPGKQHARRADDKVCSPKSSV